MDRISKEKVRMNECHQVENVHIEKGIISLIVNGQVIRHELKNISPLLAIATQEEQQEFEVSPSGYGIHWPLIDEDVSIDGLLGILHKPDLYREVA